MLARIGSKPSPLLAPFTRPAMSTNSKVVVVPVEGYRPPIFLALDQAQRSRLHRFNCTKGKLAASALLLEIALNKVDLPTLGSLRYHTLVHESFFEAQR